MATSVDLARRLLAAAENDELMARSVLPVPGVTDAGVGMLTQQAVEKAIKAVLAARGVEFPFTHNLRVLREFAEGSGIDLPAALDDIETLTPFASDERYGGETPIGLDRDRALAWATASIAWAHEQIDLIAPEQDEPGQAATGPADVEQRAGTDSLGEP